MALATTHAAKHLVEIYAYLLPADPPRLFQRFSPREPIRPFFLNACSTYTIRSWVGLGSAVAFEGQNGSRLAQPKRKPDSAERKTMTDEASVDLEFGQSRGVNLSNLAYRSVSDMIRGRRLKGGEAIVESRLAEHLGISRTPLREALQRLEGEGLVLKGAARSFVVRHVDLGEYLQSLRVREILEPEAAAMSVGHVPRNELAAVRAEMNDLRSAPGYHTDAHWRSDDNLHELFARNSGNEVLANVIRSMRTTTRLFEIARLSDRIEPDAAEHLAILDAIETEDAKAARKAVQAHIRSIGAFAIATVR